MTNETQKKPTNVKEIINDVDKVKKTMKDNIQLLLERGKKLEELNKNTHDLKQETKQLQQKSKVMERQFRWNNYLIYAVVIGTLGGSGLGVICNFGSLTTLFLAGTGGLLGYSGNWILNKTSASIEQISDTLFKQKENSFGSFMEEKQNKFTPTFDDAKNQKPPKEDSSNQHHHKLRVAQTNP